MPKCALYFFTADLILIGWVEPHLSLIFKPFGVIPIEITFAPKSVRSFGAAL